MKKDELRELRAQRALEQRDELPPVNEGKSMAFSAFAVFIISLGFQILHWYLYEMLQFDMSLLSLTPLILVLGYYVVIKDAGVGHTLPKRFIFKFGCIAPLVLGIIVSIICYFNDPNLSIFIGTESDSDTKLKIILALYSFRVALTSLYLTIGALVIYAFSKLSS
ncbi:MAG: hypothetical protein IJO29_02645 [Oscillospiraceae bacterium]|nr:hypothetical protein [Oscillospiraceae bacterium]